MTRDELETLIEVTAENLSRIVNAGDYRDMQKFAELMMRDHRTLIQSKMSLFLCFVELLDKAHKADMYDLRNEASCKLATEIMKITPSVRMPLI